MDVFLSVYNDIDILVLMHVTYHSCISTLVSGTRRIQVPVGVDGSNAQKDRLPLLVKEPLIVDLPIKHADFPYLC